MGFHGNILELEAQLSKTQERQNTLVALAQTIIKLIQACNHCTCRNHSPRRALVAVATFKLSTFFVPGICTWS